jgi:hypothetical protein
VPAEDAVSHRFLRPEHALALLAPLALAASQLVACGAAQSEESTLDTTPTATAAASADPSPKWSDKASSKAKDDDLNDAQKEQMEIALRRGGDKAANCAVVVPDAPRGEGEVKVTFDGKKGRAIDVLVPAPWAGTATESCIKRAFVGEIIVPFDGQLEVPYTVKLPPKAEPDKGAKGKPPKK